MKTPSKAPKLKAELDAREMELIGCDEDGRMSLWDVGMVRPVTRFKSDGRWIEDGHYVIQWKGHAITVHCGNFADGNISLLFMCSRQHVLSLPRAKVEAMLLGKVIPDPKQTARITEMLRQLADAHHAHTRAPHLQRGRILPRSRRRNRHGLGGGLPAIVGCGVPRRLRLNNATRRCQRRPNHDAAPGQLQ